MLVAAAGIGIIGVIGGGMSGCWTYRKGDPARLSREPVAVQPGDWPLRTTEVLENLAAKTPKEIRRFELAPGAKLKDVQDAKMREAITKPDTTVVHQGVYGKCLLRVFGEMVRSSDKQRDQQIRAQEKKWTGFESNARTLTSRTISNPDAEAVRKFFLEFNQLLNEDLAEEKLPYRYSIDSTRYHITSGLAVRIPPEQVTKPRGVLIHLTALVGNPFEIKVMDHLERAGWISFDIDTQTSVFPGTPEKNRAKTEPLIKREAEIDSRLEQLFADKSNVPFTDSRISYVNLFKPEHRPEVTRLMEEREKISKQLEKLTRGTFELCPGDDADAMAALLASELDNAIAGNAYAVEAIVEYIKRNRQDLDGVPIVVIGFSAGGLATPASVARVRDKVEAAVMVGAGANLLRLSQESTLTDGGVRLRCEDKKLPRSVREDLYVRYLKYTKLDPYHTSQAMMGMPVLMLHGSWDEWVPARGGELLWEQLGKPDRVTLAGGHTLLFYLLPGQSERIAKWLEENVRRP